MTNLCQQSIRISKDCRNKGFMLTIKETWERVCSLKNQFFNINSCKSPSTSSLKSFIWFWRVVDKLLPIYFFIPSTCPEHDAFRLANRVAFTCRFCNFVYFSSFYSDVKVIRLANRVAFTHRFFISIKVNILWVSVDFYAINIFVTCKRTFGICYFYVINHWKLLFLIRSSINLLDP